MIRRLMDAPVVGNYEADKELFDLAHQILTKGDFNLSQKKFALRRIDEAMGTTSDRPVTLNDIQDYLDNLKNQGAK